MEIVSFRKDYLEEMAGIFIQNFKSLRSIVPLLPDLMEEKDRVAGMLGDLMEVCSGIVALDGAKVLGYIGWFEVNNFRESGRKTAYCPEWGHGAVEAAKPTIYRAMYREAARRWAERGCNVHALTLLAHDDQAKNTWFWNGFGMLVVDAIRSTTLPLEESLPNHFCIRQATLADIEALQVMETEHAAHYRQAPVLMEAYQPVDAHKLEQFLNSPQDSIWLAMDGNKYMAYLRFEVNNSDVVAVVSSPHFIENTGAYVRPEYRGRKVAASVLNTALRSYANQGFRYCSVDFESFNPEAVAFWLKSFDPVCFSLMRIPERQLYTSNESKEANLIVE